MMVLMIQGSISSPIRRVEGEGKGGGMEEEGKLIVIPEYHTSLADSSNVISNLRHCACIRYCTRNCHCSRAGVHCTRLRKCEGGCKCEVLARFIF